MLTDFINGLSDLLYSYILIILLLGTGIIFLMSNTDKRWYFSVVLLGICLYIAPFLFVVISTVSKIFKINDSKKTRKGYKKMTGLHGAPNESVLSILLNGLKTPNELRKNKIEYRNTGNALGHGVYFTAHNQVTKSIQYTSNYDKRYIIIADIEYDENNVYDNNNHYGQRIDTSKYSLIRAENISAWSYSEYVVPNSKQINIRYIVELS